MQQICGNHTEQSILLKYPGAISHNSVFGAKIRKFKMAPIFKREFFFENCVKMFVHTCPTPVEVLVRVGENAVTVTLCTRGHMTCTLLLIVVKRHTFVATTTEQCKYNMPLMNNICHYEHIEHLFRCFIHV